MECESAELSILLTDDCEIKSLNHAYRHKDYATDVLSFPLEEGADVPCLQERYLGDVVISLETASKQAVANELTFMQEIARLLIHGILHLLGYDHENVPDETAQLMQNKEDELWNALVDDS